MSRRLERPAKGRALTTEEDNKAIVHRWIDEAYRLGNLGIVDELFSPDYAANGRHLGRDGVKGAVTMIKTAFPDITIVVDEIVAEGERVVLRVTTRGTHLGPFMGMPATGRAMTMGGIMIYRVIDGLIVEDHEAVDEAGLLRQLGAIAV
jgi:steroid delta-isomerase-like uncharacterized protein